MRSIIPISIFIIVPLAILGAGLVVPSWYPDTRWHHIPLHASIEALGALCAVVMGVVLWQRTRGEADRPALALSTGFLAMGLLEMFHAVAAPGNGFILLRHLASLLGGVGFALVWLPLRRVEALARPPWPWIIVVVSLALGLGITVSPGSLPEMIRNGQFAPVAVAPIALASLLFLSSALWFFLAYRRARDNDSLLFAGLTLLFGMAELMVAYSVPWDPRWWLWHGLRLLAYTLVLGYLLIGYQHMVSELRVSLIQTQQAEEAVRRNERQLRRSMEERELIGQDLHDGIIQTLFALTLGLERCQRLVTTDPQEVVNQLGLGAQSLKAAIRDLRAFIAGLEPHVKDGRELEAALALQVRLLNASGDVEIELHVEPAVAEVVSPVLATHLLHVAREAISNSLRHARATHAVVMLGRRNDRLRLEVHDDGLGFVVEQAQPGGGLKNMAARALKVNGTLTINSVPGHGTQLVFEAPVERVYA